MGELRELGHELVRYQLPLNVESEAGLVDPPIQPGAAVSTVKVLRLEFQKNAGVVLREEEVFAAVIEVTLRNILVLYFDKFRQILIVCIVVVLAGILPCLAALHSVMY